MDKKPLYKNIHLVLLLTAIATDLLLYFVFMYVNNNTLVPHGLTAKEFWRENWLILLQFYSITYFVYYSIYLFDKRFLAAQNTARRFVLELVFIIIGGFFLQEIFRTVFINFVVRPEDPKTLNVKLRMLQMVNVTAILVQYSFMTSVRIYRYLQEKQLEVVRLQKEYTQSQFEALKNQLNPHFLFNSLSVLSSLVYIDANLAETFIEKLSKTYRYLLEQRDKEKVELGKELEFLHAYQYLLAQRFGKKLNLQIEPVTSAGFIIPHSLLIAMEYIISNNAMSSLQPLTIYVQADAEAVQICYEANNKKTTETNSAAQLQHLHDRYQLVNSSAQVLPAQKQQQTCIVFPFI